MVEAYSGKMVFMSCEFNHLLEILVGAFQPYFEVKGLPENWETMY